MTKKVVWTPLAARSLVELTEYVRRMWDETIVDDLHSMIDDSIHSIAVYPGIGVVVEGSEFRKLVMHKNVSLFYSVDSDSVKILLIWDNRMEDATIFSNLTKSGQ